MKIVIADYPDVLGRDIDKEYALLRQEIPDANIVLHPYTDPEAFYREMADADGLLTAFIPLDRKALDRMPQLKAISINATGYNFVDLEETERRDIPGWSMLHRKLGSYHCFAAGIGTKSEVLYPDSRPGISVAVLCCATADGALRQRDGHIRVGQDRTRGGAAGAGFWHAGNSRRSPCR